MALPNILQSLVPAGVAAWLLDLPKKQIDRVIDEGSLPSTLFAKQKNKRLIRAKGLAYMKFSALEKRRLSLAFRKNILARMVKADTLVWSEAHITVDLRKISDELMKRANVLDEVQAAVVEDVEILDGEPCLKGTRMPVYMVAAMKHEGASVNELVKSYPSLSPSMIRNACLFAEVFPKRGRPSIPVWRKNAPIQRTRVPKVSW